jgi:hypothetical protein
MRKPSKLSRKTPAASRRLSKALNHSQRRLAARKVSTPLHALRWRKTLKPSPPSRSTRKRSRPWLSIRKPLRR